MVKLHKKPAQFLLVPLKAGTKFLRPSLFIHGSSSVLSVLFRVKSILSFLVNAVNLKPTLIRTKNGAR